MDEAVLMSCDQKWELAAHIVNGHGDVGLTNWLQGLGSLWHLPEFDAGIPSTRDHDRGAIEVQAVDILDRLIVPSDICDLLRVQIEPLYRVVSARQEDSKRINLPAHAENRAVDILLHLLLDVGKLWIVARVIVLVLHLEDQKIPIPCRCCEHAISNGHPLASGNRWRRKLQH